SRAAAAGAGSRTTATSPRCTVIRASRSCWQDWNDRSTRRSMSARSRPEFPEAAMGALRERVAAVRARTLALTRGLAPEDTVVQSLPEASPAKWHLAHTTWFFERFVLTRFEPDFAPYEAGYEFLFNSYYDAIGPRIARAERGLMSRPTFAEVCAYRRAVD